jgi:hypothetical protein
MTSHKTFTKHTCGLSNCNRTVKEEYFLYQPHLQDSNTTVQDIEHLVHNFLQDSNTTVQDIPRINTLRALTLVLFVFVKRVIVEKEKGMCFSLEIKI